jgi:hypothetical protein
VDKARKNMGRGKRKCGRNESGETTKPGEKSRT